MQCGSSSGQVCIVESAGHPFNQELNEELDEVAELAGLVALVGSAVELVGTAAELAVSAEELAGESAALAGVGTVEELLASAAADSASMTELLMGSWLKGMSTTLLELLA